MTVQNQINDIINFVNAQQQHLIAHEKRLNKLALQNQLLKGASGSKSQFYQDLFVFNESGRKRNGYFVEFGGTDGVEGSNSHFLEKEHGWQGIVAEPAKCWHERLRSNRQCHIDVRCVWNQSGETIKFCESESATLSTASEFVDSDMHSAERKARLASYDVETVSLLDLLEQHQAPAVIDYLSIDTEGSELLILSSFDFDKYDIRILTVEHNWTPDRDKIHALLASHGYERKHVDLTDCDDWYVRTIIPALQP